MYMSGCDHYFSNLTERPPVVNKNGRIVSDPAATQTQLIRLSLRYWTLLAPVPQL